MLPNVFSRGLVCPWFSNQAPYILRKQILFQIFIYKHLPTIYYCHNWAPNLKKINTVSIACYQVVPFVLTHDVLSENAFCNSVHVNYSAFHDFQRVQNDGTFHKQFQVLVDSSIINLSTLSYSRKKLKKRGRGRGDFFCEVSSFHSCLPVRLLECRRKPPSPRQARKSLKLRLFQIGLK